MENDVNNNVNTVPEVPAMPTPTPAPEAAPAPVVEPTVAPEPMPAPVQPVVEPAMPEVAAPEAPAALEPAPAAEVVVGSEDVSQYVTKPKSNKKTLVIMLVAIVVLGAVAVWANWDAISSILGK